MIYELGDLRGKQKNLSDSLKESTKLLNEKEKAIGQISSNQKKIEI